MAAENKKFDIASLDTVAASNDGAELELRHPVTNAPLGVFISIVGKDSDSFREYQRRKFNEYLRAEHAARIRGKNAPPQKSAEEYEDDMLTLLVTCTRSWKGVVFKGVDLEFNAENVRMLYKNSPWIRDQVNDAVGDLGNFLKR